MQISESVRRQVLTFQQTEITEHHIYKRLAKRIKSPENAKIIEQIPDHRIAWESESGEFTSGVVSFQGLGPNRTRVTLEIAYDPKGFMENAGDAIGVVSRRIESDLKRFKEFIENRGQETGGWRGTIREGHTPVS